MRMWDLVEVPGSWLWLSPDPAIVTIWATDGSFLSLYITALQVNTRLKKSYIAFVPET